ncbi:O-antigen ligase family protein [Aestuariivirga sp.]|uniref:O-antigen ligase family protein n=1 Tax=Aestuariivirga sp. TaxID=2650926 RepID=UPI003BACBAC3
MTSAAWVEAEAPRHVKAASHYAWPAAVSFTLLLAIVCGGSSEANSAGFITFRLLCIGLFAAALYRLQSMRLSRMEWLTLVLAMAGVAIVALQLIPIPAGLFASLPGREFVAKTFSVAGIEPHAMPLTLIPAATWGCILALLPPLAMLLSVMTMEPRTRWYLVGVVLIGAAANVFLGLAQRFLGAKSGLYLYEISNFGSATGFFSNRNNFSMLLCVAIPLTWAMTHKLIRMRLTTPPLAIGAGAVMMIIIFMGLAASNSRSGILLGMLALTLSTVMVLAAPSESRRSRRTRMSVIALLGGAFIIGQFGMTGILRVIETDPMTEYRTQIRQVTWRAAADYFPLGSGFGTFVPVYGMHETPATMVSSYVNHAHNDWLELWLEGGLPAAALMVCFVLLFVWQAVRIWNPKGAYASAVLPRAASVGALVLLLHSLVEFPLRMPALAVIFAALIAIMMAPPPRHTPSARKRGARNEEPLRERDEVPVAVAPPVFQVARDTAGLRRHQISATGSLGRRQKS